MIFMVIGLGLLAAAGVIYVHKGRNPEWMSYGYWTSRLDVPRQILIPGALAGSFLSFFLSWIL
jgi:hypothetical protein